MCQSFFIRSSRLQFVDNLNRMLSFFKLLNNALTDDINDRELFLKGIDYSNYYEEEDQYGEKD